MLNSTCRTILVCKLSQNVNSDGLTLLKALVLANWERVIMLVPNKPVCYIWTADKDANESDPRSNVYYFSSSDNKAWKKFRPWMKVILAVMCTTWAVVKIRLVSSVGRALHRYRRGHGFKSRTGLNFFSGLIFTTAQVMHITARITFIHVFIRSANIWL